jgi:hypothetical protein
MEKAKGKIFIVPRRKFPELTRFFREAFVELASPQAATALKRRIDSFGEGQQYVKKHTCIYARPDYNPFKTSPKDAPQRNKVVAPGAYNNGPAFQSGGGFRGGRGNYNRGGMNNMNTEHERHGSWQLQQQPSDEHDGRVQRRWYGRHLQ